MSPPKGKHLTLDETAVYTSLKISINTYLDNAREAIDLFGLFSERTEHTLDKIIAVYKYDFSADELMQIMDWVIDGYIVRPRIPRSQAINRWAIAYVGDGDFMLLWFNDKGHIGYMSEDAIQVTSVSLYEKYLSKGVWPLKEGYIPTPAPSRCVPMS